MCFRKIAVFLPYNLQIVFMPYTYEYPRPCVTVDIILFRNGGNGPAILLIERGNPPFEGIWAFPGGFINIDEDLETAARRELYEETGLKVLTMSQFRTYGSINRDPRHRTITVVYVAEIDDKQTHEPTAGDDACNAAWFRLEALPPLAFDHRGILEEFIREKAL
jgi:8-oxo-dGTP diphosphatase